MEDWEVPDELMWDGECRQFGHDFEQDPEGAPGFHSCTLCGEPEDWIAVENRKS